MSLWVEVLVVVLLAIANGLFSGAEIAILALRKTRLRELADGKSRGAAAVLALRDQPERFLATVQVGITVIGATAAAFSGATLAEPLADMLLSAGFGERSNDVALALVVALVSYLSLVVGELVPKSLALRAAEPYALAIGRPLLFVSWVARPLVWFLTASSNVLLRLFGDRTTFTEARLSPDELQQLVEEAATQGTLDPRASEIASRAIDLGHIRVGAVMVPRAQIVALDQRASKASITKEVLERGHARMPVYDGNIENVVGYVTSRDVFRIVNDESRSSLADVTRPAQFVPERTLALDVMKDMQKSRAHLTLVVDELGHLVGLVTLEDLMEELVGEIFEEHQIPVEVIQQESATSAVVLGTTAVHEINRELAIDLPEGAEWTTVAGLVIALAGEIPKTGKTFSTESGIKLEVLEATGRRVLKVRIAWSVPETPAEGSV